MICIIKDMEVKEDSYKIRKDSLQNLVEFTLLLKDNKFHKVSATKIVQYKELLRSERVQ